MSNQLSPTRGLHRVQAKHRLLGVATKITGRNMASVSYIAALEAERRGVEMEVRAKFGANGAMQYIEVIEGNDAHGVRLTPGWYLVLDAEESEAMILDADEYQKYYRRIDA